MSGGSMIKIVPVITIFHSAAGGCGVEHAQTDLGYPHILLGGGHHRPEIFVPHISTNSMTNKAAMLVMDSGMRICQRYSKGMAPSTRAASASSSGTVM